MLVGTLTPPSHFAEDDDRIAVLPSRSVDDVVCGLASGRCDVVVVSRDSRVLFRTEQASVWPEFAAACLLHPAAAVWLADGAGFRLMAGGCYGPPTARSELPPGASLHAVRLSWLCAWVKWITSAVRQVGYCPSSNALPARHLLESLATVLTTEPGSKIPNGLRPTQRKLRSLGLRGPKRFAMAARAFVAWELARLGKWSAERIAYEIGFSTLSCLDRSLLLVLGSTPRTLCDLTDADVSRLLSLALRRGPHDQERQTGAQNGKSDLGARW